MRGKYVSIIVAIVLAISTLALLIQNHSVEDTLNKYLISRCFIQNVLKQIYGEVDKQRKTFFTIINNISGNTNEKIKERIKELHDKVSNNEKMAKVELPVLQQRKTKVGNSNKQNDSQVIATNSNICFGTTNGISIGGNGEISCGIENNQAFETEFTDVLLKVFEVKTIISELQDILKTIGISHLVIMLDDVSEIDGTALKCLLIQLWLH